MCGICGVLGALPIDDRRKASIRAVNTALRHRGPDGSGEFEAPHLFMAMRRLAIIDLAGGFQPLYNEDHSLALIINGEIYNFVELREELTRAGHRFATRSDGETLLHLYEDHGLDAVHHLRGMFAFALWDGTNRQLVLARDRMGEKPLYLFEQDKALFFASEMKALLASKQVPFELDPAALCDYYHFGYVPDPATAVHAVRKLPAGHMLIVRPESWSTEMRCYWRMEDAPPRTGDPVEQIREQLETLSPMILRSDVPVGVSLSAGLDSGLVAALAARHSPGKIHALTVGYAGCPRQDERAGAKALARHLDMPFHEIEVHLDPMVQLFPERAVATDDPIADVASHGYYAVARCAREQGIPVLLQGQGPDELFWGYPWVQHALHLRHANFRRESVSRLIDPGRLRYCLRHALYTGFGRLLGWYRPRSYAPGQVPFYDLTEGYRMGSYAVNHVFTPAFQEKFRGYDPSSLFIPTGADPDWDVLLTRWICETYLRENGLAQGDRLTMACSVELRAPFVDAALVETVIGLRKTHPDGHLPSKAWFRQLLPAYLPAWVLQRPKTGFSPPMRQWYSAIAAAYAPGLCDGYLVRNGILAPDFLPPMTSTAFRFSAWPVLLFRTLVLEYWCRGMASAAA